jgi:lysophospholipase L1-like esterase
LGEVLSLDNLDFAWDGMHLTAAGNDVVATRLVSPVLSMWK